MDRVRIDKWLWAARFFKTRSLASQAVEGGKVRLNGERPKPSKEVKVGDRLSLHIGEDEWVVDVVQLADKRGSAPVARGLYAEEAESVQRREARIAARKLAGEPGTERRGRPTKKDRRQIHRFTDG